MLLRIKNMENPIRNIGLLAHVDAGKTTLTENLLFCAGALRRRGDVDAGTTTTDAMDLEKARGISIRAASVSFRWKGSLINLMDTPGHPDFISEVERSLSVIDGAILVVSAVEGIQSQTYILWQALNRISIPTLIVINKTDRPGADSQRVVQQLEKELRIKPVITHATQGEGSPTAKTYNIWLEKTESNAAFRIKTEESLASNHDKFLELYLNGYSFSWQEIKSQIKQQTMKCEVVPILSTIAKKYEGTEDLLTAITDYFAPAMPTLSNDKVAGIVFKVEHDPVNGRLAHVRLFNGKINTKEIIFNFTQKKDIKIASIKKKFTNRQEDYGALGCGDIGILGGIPWIRPGDILGDPKGIRHHSSLLTPVLALQIHPENDADYGKLGMALEILDAEDPHLNYSWFKEEKKMQLTLTGPIRIQIICSELLTRFGLKVLLDEPTVIYKESPESQATGYVEYTMPKPCWAVLAFRIEPGEPGSGITYRSEIGVNKIQKKYQNEIEKTVPKALEQGLKGWEVTDIVITLIDGEDHPMHSRPGDFILATPMGIMNALKKSGTRLLEPVYRFHINAPESYLGKIAGDIHLMRGTFETPVFEDTLVKISGTLPVATSLDYGIKLSTATQGKGIIRYTFAGYQDCPPGVGKTRPFRGINPLDNSKWILHHRGAYKADERKF